MKRGTFDFLLGLAAISFGIHHLVVFNCVFGGVGILIGILLTVLGLIDITKKI